MEINTNFSWDIYDSFPGAVLVKDSDLTIVYVNPSFIKKNGSHFSEYTAKKDTAVDHELLDHRAESSELDILLRNSSTQDIALISSWDSELLWNVIKFVQIVNGSKFLVIQASPLVSNAHLLANTNNLYLKAIADYSDSAMAVLDKDCKIKNFLESDRIINKSDMGFKTLIAEIIDTNKHKVLKANIEKVISTRKLFVDKNYVTYQDKDYVFKDSYYPIENFDGNVYEVGIIRQDISASSEIQLAYQTIVNNSTFGIVIFQQKHCIFLNNVVPSMVGVRKRDILGYHVNKLLYQYMEREDADELLEFFANMESDINKSLTITMPFKTINGDQVWFECFGNTIIYEGLPAVQVALIDVTERKKAEYYLERYKHIMNSSHEEIIYINDQSHIQMVNNSFLRSFDYTFDYVIGKHISNIFGSEHYDSVLKKYISLCFKNDQSYQTENWLLYPGGERFIELSFFPYREKDDELTVSGVVILFRDITEEIKTDLSMVDIAENERRKIAMELHDGLTHDLLGISIQAKMLSTKLLKKDLAEAGDVKVMHDNLNAAIQLARTLSKGISPIQEEKKSFTAMIEELRETVVRRYNITCRLSMNDRVDIHNPRILENIYYIIDEAITNSVKHSETREVWIDVVRDNEFLLITVGDNGKGFDSAELYEGMGLKFIKVRCRSISASLNVASKKGEGTQITFKLRV
jgi:PAS domain S-box-containing protein